MKRRQIQNGRDSPFSKRREIGNEEREREKKRIRRIYIIFPLLIVQDLSLNTRVILNANVPAGSINRVRAITRNVSVQTVSLQFRSGSGNER